MGNLRRPVLMSAVVIALPPFVLPPGTNRCPEHVRADEGSHPPGGATSLTHPGERPRSR